MSNSVLAPGRDDDHDVIGSARDMSLVAARRFRAGAQRARAMAQERELILQTHVLLQTYVLAGHPVPTVIDLARELGIDLLVIGAAGHSAPYVRMIGSRADRIIRLASCPVLVVK